MNTSQRAPATAKVADFLQLDKRQNQERGINPERIKIIDRLLAHGDTLESAWAEILEKSAKIHPHGSTWQAWQFVIDRLLFVAEFKTPETARRQGQVINEVAELNQEIAELATMLARKMRYRNSLQGPHDITLPADNDPVQLMERAAELGQLNRHCQNLGGRFKDWVKPGLDQLWFRFDWQYWPDMTDMLDALADAQGPAELGYIDPTPTSEISAALTASRERSTSDFYRALDTALAELDDHYQTAVVGPELTADTYADLCNALLGLDADITPKAVKTYRNRVAQQAGTTDA